MKKFILLLLLASPTFLFSQSGLIKPILQPDAPEWVQLMYAETPNVFAVESAFEAYYKTHPYEENNYTKYYTRWAITARQYVNENGDIIIPDNLALQENILLRNKLHSGEGSRSTTWTFA